MPKLKENEVPSYGDDSIHRDNGFGGVEGNVTIFCGEGDDHVLGFGGNDTIWGGGGADYVDGGSGRDSLAGEGGDDYFIAADGEIDTLIGGAGMSGFCMARHGRAINVVFLDGHARTVPLAELWKLKWNRRFVPTEVTLPPG